MSILNVDQISPIGSGSTITVTATETKTGNITIGTGSSIFSPAGNTLVLGTNNLERIRIKNDGKIGINTTNAVRNLEVFDATQATIAIKSSDTGQSSLWLSDSSDDNIGGIYYEHSNNNLVFRVNDGERLRIGSSGQMGLSGSNYGTAGQVLTSQGSGSAVQWATPASWTTAASFDCASATPGALEVTGLDNPQVIMFVYHELRHSASSRCVMQIGNDSTGYQASGYFDIGTYRSAGGTETSTRGHNQAQWYPLDYNFTVNTNLYSGKTVLTRTFNRWSYESSIDVSYSGTNTQYDIMWRGHNRNFSSPLNRIKLVNDAGGNFNSGYVTILTQS